MTITSSFPVIDLPVTARYVPADWRSRGHHATTASCAWCSRGTQGTHERVLCLACEVPQCKASTTCRACIRGWLPGWSRGMGRPEHKLCGYKGCDNPAVADAPRVGRVCQPHLTRVKAHGRTLLDLMVEDVDHAINHTGGYSTQWRRLVVREASQ